MSKRNIYLETIPPEEAVDPDVLALDAYPEGASACRLPRRALEALCEPP